ncbi:Lactonase drp35 [Pseudovibrio axinellae]|uniref:Lactonase drp35 n=1 Tax=Pseudovibrio axinellae TaxID=989403 RepID=A0A166BD21_9HYPH|nr:SMP-30/gluconolactonase/LRE family protein [Pseudovibrio axinellae]KZL22140.1 Lactonase drp35 [Pseudovibrio axinellae]SEQ53697.1 gluconolactonase [Pseudovibrio axinellae]
MIGPKHVLTARPRFELPKGLKHKGEPSKWAQMTRPGMQMHSFLEGAFFDDEENLWLCDVPYGRVFKVSPLGTWQLMHHIDGELHSMRIAPDGRLIAVDYRHGLIELTSYDRFTVLSAGYGSEEFLGLSDMCFGSDGTLWFTDSGRTSLSDPAGRLFCLPVGGSVQLVADCVPYSNGVCLSPDGAWVYVAATRANQVLKLSSNLPKTGKPMVGTYLQLSGGLGPDGLATNAKGLLAVAQAQAGRAYIFTPLGDLHALVHLPKGLWTTSVAFHPQETNRLMIVDAQFGCVFDVLLPD